MGRRSVFGEGAAPAIEPSPVMSGPPAVSIVDSMPVAEQRHRNRPWDEARRSSQVAYRGISKEVQEAVKALAKKLNVSVDDMARALLECGWSAYQAGELKLRASIKGVRMTLYPVEQEERAVKPVKGRSAGRGKKSQPQPDWKRVVSYRGIPDDVQQGIRGLAAEKTVPVGEVARAFLQYGLAQVEAGKLVLTPVEKGGQGKTLFG